jgi:hypothetical protein
MSFAVAAEAPAVKAGLYYSFLDGDAVRIEAGAIEAPRDLSRYVRLPAPLLLAIGPLLGFLFVMFLPLLSLLMMAAVPVRSVARLVSRKTAREELAVPALVQKHGVEKRLAQPE